MIRKMILTFSIFLRVGILFHFSSLSYVTAHQHWWIQEKLWLLAILNLHLLICQRWWRGSLTYSHPDWENAQGWPKARLIKSSPRKKKKRWCKSSSMGLKSRQRGGRRDTVSLLSRKQFGNAETTRCLMHTASLSALDSVTMDTHPQNISTHVAFTVCI